jgi:molybdopterin-guanine dinucleotide biosynthesis protein
MENSEIEGMLTTTKQVITAVNADADLRKLQATNAKLTFDAYIAEGFSEEQAVTLVASSMKSMR